MRVATPAVTMRWARARLASSSPASSTRRSTAFASGSSAFASRSAVTNSRISVDWPPRSSWGVARNVSSADANASGSASTLVSGSASTSDPEAAPCQVRSSETSPSVGGSSAGSPSWSEKSAAIERATPPSSCFSSESGILTVGLYVTACGREHPNLGPFRPRARGTPS